MPRSIEPFQYVGFYNKSDAVELSFQVLMKQVVNKQTGKEWLHLRLADGSIVKLHQDRYKSVDLKNRVAWVAPDYQVFLRK